MTAPSRRQALWTSGTSWTQKLWVIRASRIPRRSCSTFGVGSRLVQALTHGKA